MPLDATIAGASSNSYATRAEANLYFADQLYPESWEAGDDGQKDKALMLATRLLDENVHWIGTKQTGSQALEWPRGGATDRAGYAILPNTIPVALKNATAEYAALLIAEGAAPGGSGDNPPGLQSVKAGSVELQFEPSLAGETQPVVPDAVWSMIRFLMESRTAGASVVTLVRR